MTRIPAAAPQNLEPAVDWRAAGLCLNKDPDLFCPVGTTAAALRATAQAKAICRRCPSVAACLDYALDTPVPDGILGGLTEQERASLLRAKARYNLSAADIQARAEEMRRPPKEPRTMQGVFDESTTRLHGGHLAWTGLTEVKFDGRKYSPKQLAFTLDRGRFPDGSVLPDCGVKECVLARHLRDRAERAQWTAPVKAVSP
ncbi:hypothetical protein GCM10023084_02650 [Streptomyces lacrimifluminis]|uniref:WhiB family transcriptional regulator n=1 Tax=Streptomyces lacrimifluminis TaxID=1500077 RepID=UPI0031E7DAA6